MVGSTFTCCNVPVDGTMGVGLVCASTALPFGSPMTYVSMGSFKEKHTRLEVTETGKASVFAGPGTPPPTDSSFVGGIRARTVGVSEGPQGASA